MPCNPTASISGNTASLWARYIEDSDQIEFHFPLELKDIEDYTAEDLATFNVDDELEIYEGFILKTGDYPVQETATELVILVDLLPEVE